jgi:hypothetical protein
LGELELAGNAIKFLDKDGKNLFEKTSASCFSHLSSALDMVSRAGKPKSLTYQLTEDQLVKFWKVEENRQRFVQFVMELYPIFSEIELTYDSEFKEFSVDLEEVSGPNIFALFVALRYMEEFGAETKYIFNYTDNFNISPREAFICFHYLGLSGNYNHHFYGRKEENYIYQDVHSLDFNLLIEFEPTVSKGVCFLKNQWHAEPGLWRTYSPVKAATQNTKKDPIYDFLIKRAKDKAVKTNEDVNRILTPKYASL